MAYHNQSSRVRVMGVINTTPDSFSDGGRYDTTMSTSTKNSNAPSH